MFGIIKSALTVGKCKQNLFLIILSGFYEILFRLFLKSYGFDIQFQVFSRPGDRSIANIHVLQQSLVTKAYSWSRLAQHSVSSTQSLRLTGCMLTNYTVETSLEIGDVLCSNPLHFLCQQ